MAVVVDASDKLDFSGSWLNVSQEGTAELLQKLNVPWMKRKVAAGMNFGVGKQRVEIEQDGDVLKIKTIGFKTFENTIKVGGGEMTVQSASGPVPSTAEWGPGGELVQDTLMMGGKVRMTRRILDDDTMTLTIECGEVVSKRIFKRQSS